MAKPYHVIVVFLFLLAFTVTQGQRERALARESAENSLNVEPITSTLHEPPRTSSRSLPSSIQLAKPVVTHSTRHDIYSWLREKISNLANTSFVVRSSARKAQLTEGLKSVINYISRTYRYLKAAREYERAVQKHADTIEYAVQRQKLIDFMGGTTRPAPLTSLSVMPSTRTTEIQTIADAAALRYEDVPGLALTLEGIVRQGVRYNSFISQIPLRYVQYQWRRVLLGFWREKLAIGLTAIFKGCVWDAGIGECRPVVGYVVAFLLLGPIWALLDEVILASKRWWASDVL